MLHTNRTYLSGYIKTTYDMSFRDWITGLRIEYAKRLLARYPRLTIADISEKSGFLSPSHFIRLFKEMQAVPLSNGGKQRRNNTVCVDGENRPNDKK